MEGTEGALLVRAQAAGRPTKEDRDFATSYASNYVAHALAQVSVDAVGRLRSRATPLPRLVPLLDVCARWRTAGGVLTLAAGCLLCAVEQSYPAQARHGGRFARRALRADTDSCSIPASCARLDRAGPPSALPASRRLLVRWRAGLEGEGARRELGSSGRLCLRLSRCCNERAMTRRAPRCCCIPVSGYCIAQGARALARLTEWPCLRLAGRDWKSGEEVILKCA